MNHQDYQNQNEHGYGEENEFDFDEEQFILSELAGDFPIFNQ